MGLRGQAPWGHDTQGLCMHSPCLERLVCSEKTVVWIADYEHGKQAQTMMNGLQAIGLKAANMPRQAEQ